MHELHSAQLIWMRMSDWYQSKLVSAHRTQHAHSSLFSKTNLSALFKLLFIKTTTRKLKAVNAQPRNGLTCPWIHPFNGTQCYARPFSSLILGKPFSAMTSRGVTNLVFTVVWVCTILQMLFDFLCIYVDCCMDTLHSGIGIIFD